MEHPGGIEPHAFHPTLKDQFRRLTWGQGVNLMKKAQEKVSANFVNLHIPR